MYGLNVSSSVTELLIGNAEMDVVDLKILDDNKEMHFSEAKIASCVVAPTEMASNVVEVGIVRMRSNSSTFCCSQLSVGEVCIGRTNTKNEVRLSNVETKHEDGNGNTCGNTYDHKFDNKRDYLHINFNENDIFSVPRRRRDKPVIRVR